MTSHAALDLLVGEELRSAEQLLGPHSDESDPPSPARPRRRIGRVVRAAGARITPLGVLTTVAFVLYICVGIWIRYDLDYAIGDAIARTANAQQMLFGRDPHLAALGFVWPPWTTVAQIPFMLLLRPFGQTEFAGPIVSAFTVSGTIVVIGRMCRERGLGRWASSAILVSFAFNPAVIFQGAIGMSEASTFLFLAITLRFFLRFVDDDETSSLALASLGLIGLVMTRTESLGVVLAIGVAVLLADLRGHNRRHALTSAFIVVLPPVVAFGLWVFAQWLLLGDALFFAHYVVAANHPTLANQPYLPHVEERPVEAVLYVARWMVLLAPAFFVCAVPMVMGRTRQLVAGFGVLGASLVFPVVQVLLLLKEQSFGGSRYFSSAIVAGTISAVWLVARTRRRSAWRFMTAVALLAALLGGWVGSVWGLRDPVNTSPEGEAVVFARLTGGDYQHKYAVTAQHKFDVWRDVAADLDRRLEQGEEVIIEARVAFSAQLFSSRPSMFITNSDRDYARTLADPARLPEYAVGLEPGTLDFELDGVAALVERTSAAWEEVAGFGNVNIYKRIGDVDPSTFEGSRF